jgi:hypothetical protein
MKEIVRFLDDLPWILKLIFALPAFDNVVWGIYRVAKGLQTNNGTMVIVGLLWIFVLGWVGFVIDIYTILTVKKVTVFA